MHIVDGVLSNTVLLTGAVATAVGVGVGLKKVTAEQLPMVGVLSATFFVASLIHVPIGPSSVHLILNGLLGLVLGWAAFPALLVALILQAVFFGYGGVVVLGVNAFNIALPAVLMGMACRPMIQKEGKLALVGGFLCGAGAIVLTTVMVALSLAMSGDAFMAAAKLTFFAHLPVVLIEGLLTASAVWLLSKVRPETMMISEAG